MMIAMPLAAVIVLLVSTSVCVLVDPAPGIDSLTRRIEQCRAKQCFRRNLAVCDNLSRCPGVKRDKSSLQVLDRFRLRKISLGDQQAVGERRLFDRLGVLVDVP